MGRSRSILTRILSHPPGVSSASGPTLRWHISQARVSSSSRKTIFAVGSQHLAARGKLGNDFGVGERDAMIGIGSRRYRIDGGTHRIEEGRARRSEAAMMADHQHAISFASMLHGLGGVTGLFRARRPGIAGQQNPFCRRDRGG